MHEQLAKGGLSSRASRGWRWVQLLSAVFFDFNRSCIHGLLQQEQVVVGVGGHHEVVEVLIGVGLEHVVVDDPLRDGR